MKRNRLFVLTFAVLMLSGLCGCNQGPVKEQEPPQSSEPANSTAHFDIDAYKAKIEALRGIWDQTGQDALVKKQISEMLSTVDDVYADYARAEIAYYKDWNRDELREKRNAAYEDLYVVSDMTRWMIANGYHRSGYGALFEPYQTSEDVNYYLMTTLPRVIASAKSDASDSAQMLEDYYSAAYDDTTDTGERNLQCAQLYLDILNSSSAYDYDYEAYLRDYTPEDVAAVYAEMCDAFLSVYAEASELLLENDAGLPAVADPMAILQTYAPKLSGSITESVGKLFEGALYTIVRGDDCYDGSFTVALPSEHAALMYLYFYDDFTDLTTAVHEFGHFNSEWRCQTPVLLQQNCVDLAEVQSQGMEILFTAFDDDCLHDDAKAAEQLTLYNMIDAVVSGLCIGKFENAVMEQAELLQPEDVLELYERYCTSCGVGLELYEITHLYEQPGYYVSYGVSALAALQLYVQLQTDRDEAIRSYEKLCGCSSLSGAYRFRQAMQECGMADVFAAGQVTAISQQLSVRLKELQ